MLFPNDAFNKKRFAHTHANATHCHANTTHKSDFLLLTLHFCYWTIQTDSLNINLVSLHTVNERTLINKTWLPIEKAKQENFRKIL